MLNYVKLIAKQGFYYDQGTEVFDYDGKRYTIEEWNKCIEEEICGARGLRNGEYDGEMSVIEEFDVEYGVEFKEIKDA
jgi:hypothetical protein